MARNIPLRSDKTRSGKSETGKGIKLIQLLMRKFSCVKQIPNDRQRISRLLKRKLQKTTEGKLFGQSVRPFGQKILFDQKERKNGTNQKYSGSAESIGRIQNGTDLRIWISTLVFSPKNSRYSEAFT